MKTFMLSKAVAQSSEAKRKETSGLKRYFIDIVTFLVQLYFLFQNCFEF